MMIRVIYKDFTYDMATTSILDDLLTTNKILAFQRSSGWVRVGRDPIRGMGGEYRGPERRGSGGAPPEVTH
ncbi:MAG TPA: hypothetical protein VFG19_10110 [Geobacteraceae bacterium]|nr:hypothetical protein [Geobacteraceae bacterium]